MKTMLVIFFTIVSLSLYIDCNAKPQQIHPIVLLVLQSKQQFKEVPDRLIKNLKDTYSIDEIFLNASSINSLCHIPQALLSGLYYRLQ